VVLQHGTVAERGRHEDLLGIGGLYADMWRRQQEGAAGEAADAPSPGGGGSSNGGGGSSSGGGGAEDPSQGPSEASFGAFPAADGAGAAGGRQEGASKEAE
jgi:hypothetical protein